MKPTAHTRRAPRVPLVLLIALAVCLATPVTALAGTEYIVGNQANNDWASYGGGINLIAGDTLTISVDAGTDANGTTINIDPAASGVTIRGNDAVTYTDLHIVAGDGASIAIENLSLVAPSAPTSEHGILMYGVGEITVTGNCVITGGASSAGLAADIVTINNSGNLTINAGGAQAGIWAEDVIYHGTDASAMAANGAGGAGIEVGTLTVNGGTVNANGDTGFAGVSSPDVPGTSLNISVSDGLLKASGKGNGPGMSSQMVLLIHNNGRITVDSEDGNGLDAVSSFTYGGTGELHVSAESFGIISSSFTQNGGLINTFGELEEGVYVTDGSILTVTAGTLKASSDTRLGINFDEAPPHTVVMGPGARVEIRNTAGIDWQYNFRQDHAGNTWNGTGATMTGNPTDTAVTYTIADGDTGIITLAAPNPPPVPNSDPDPGSESGGGYPMVLAHETTPPVITASSATPLSERAAALSVQATDPSLPLSYQWQNKQPDNTWLSIPGAARADFDYALLEQGKTYTVRCRVADAYGNTAYTNAMTFTLDALVEAVEENPFPCTGVVIAGSVYIRPDPSTKGKALGKVYKSDELTLLGYVAPKGYSYGFYEVAWDNAAGYAYISADYVRTMFGAPLPAAIGGKVYAQSRMSISSKARAATFNKGDGVQLVGREGKWWMLELGGQIRYVQNGRHVQPVQY